MGMANSDDEDQIAEDHALREWAKEMPTKPEDWDHPMNDEERSNYEDALKKWHKKRPKTRSPYDNDRR